MIKIYTINKNEELTLELIKRYIDVFKGNEMQQMIKNKAYYDCENPTIMNRTFSDATKPNNKIACAWGNYITTLLTGYFIGKPISYEVKDEDFNNILKLYANDELSRNAQLSRDASVYGVAYELAYINSNKELAFTKLNPTQIIPIYDDTVEQNLLYVIRFYNNNYINDYTNEFKLNIELYTNKGIKVYSDDELKEVIKHKFNKIPISIIKNNEDNTGDFELVEKLIDLYDLALSDTANFRSELNDSYLVFKECTNLTDEDIRKMKANRIFTIESGDGEKAGIEWLNKDSKDTENENFKTRIENDIKRFSFVDDLETIKKSHISSASIKLGLCGIEQLTTEKENYFRQAIYNRLQLIANIYKKLKYDFDVNDVTLTFTRNLPSDLVGLADTLIKMKDIVSRKSLISQVPFISSIDDELAQIQEENKYISNDKDLNTV